MASSSLIPLWRMRWRGLSSLQQNKWMAFWWQQQCVGRVMKDDTSLSYLSLCCTELGCWHDAMLVFGNVDKSYNEKDIRMYMTLYNRKNGSHKSIEWNEQINKFRYYGSSQKVCWWVCCVYSRVNYFILLLLVVLWWINQSIVELITFTNLLYLNSNSIRKLYRTIILTH
jgi:hypothetical protein